MATLSEGSVVPSSGATVRRLIITSARDVQGSPALLLVLAGLPVIVAAWALASPAVLFSKEMTQDLLFNLGGAWHVYHGHVAHVDFHDPTGRLSFILTAIGFHLVGPGPLAFLVNVAIMTTALFAAAFFAATPRLPLLPAAIFIVFIGLLALMPVNVGDRPEQYTFAMSYNRYSWSAYSILCLILFVPPHDRSGRAWIDLVVGGALLAVMFYLKITYFAVGLATVGFAVLVHPHVGRHWAAWLAILTVLVANALAPYNQAYLADIVGWTASGAVRKSLALQLNNFVAAAAQYGPYLAATLVACWMWWSGRAALRLPLTLAFLLAASLLLLSQNSQAAGLPSGIVILLVLYDELRRHFSPLRNRDIAPLLVTLLVLPVFTAGGFAVSIAGYSANADASRGLYVVEHTNLRGLAIPDGDRGAFLGFSHAFDYPARAKASPAPPLYQLADYEYVLVLLEAADLLGAHEPGGIALLDSVNPLPFMLGLKPPRGANLWSAWNAPVRSAPEYLADVRYVLIPKFPKGPDWTADLVGLYGSYLQEHFRQAAETRSWLLLIRSPTDQQTSGGYRNL
jgi:hypothetical protein